MSYERGTPAFSGSPWISGGAASAGDSLGSYVQLTRTPRKLHGYLARKTTTPLGPFYAQGPVVVLGDGCFLMGEVPLQVHLAHEKHPPPHDLHKSLSIGLLWGLTGGVFLMSEVPLHSKKARIRRGPGRQQRASGISCQCRRGRASRRGGADPLHALHAGLLIMPQRSYMCRSSGGPGMLLRSTLG